MYAKIFASIYDGTIAEDWTTRCVFMDFLILADANGVVDMTPEAISRRTNVPIEIVKNAVKKLEAPDDRSRNPTDDGVRIRRIDDHRDWGWQIVNYQYFRRLHDAEQKREADRERMRRNRENEKSLEIKAQKSEVAESRFSSLSVAGSRFSSRRSLSVAEVAEGEGEGKGNKTLTTLSGKARRDTKGSDLKKQAVEVLEFLNEQAGKSFRPVESNLKLIMARLRTGATVQNCKGVIVRKCRDWLGDPEMVKYLRPETLFNATKFESYLGQRRSEAVCDAKNAAKDSQVTSVQSAGQECQESQEEPTGW